MLVIFVNVTSTYIMTIKKIRLHAKKVKCLQTNIVQKIKLIIIRKIIFHVPLTVFYNLIKNVTINKQNKIK